MMRFLRRAVLVGLASGMVAFGAPSASAQMLVYDPSNYAQNVLQAARALQQINNQITSLQNQALMLLNQARNLASLPYSSLQAIDQSIARTAQLLSDAQTRWQNALAGYQDALRVQAGVVQALDVTRAQTDALVSSSQSATGMLQATQAGNQLVALQTRQLLDLTALIAAQSRAQSLAGARTTASDAQAQAQFNQFLSNGQSYQPQTVQMFH